MTIGMVFLIRVCTGATMENNKNNINKKTTTNQFPPKTKTTNKNNNNKKIIFILSPHPLKKITTSIVFDCYFTDDFANVFDLRTQCTVVMHLCSKFSFLFAGKSRRSLNAIWSVCLDSFFHTSESTFVSFLSCEL